MNPKAARLYSVLNVAEKPSIAKKITEFLSNNDYTREKSQSKFNPIFSFPFELSQFDQLASCRMHFTSVLGHLQQLKFLSPNSKWREINALNLFKDKLEKTVPTEHKPLLWNLENLSKKCKILVLWLDCDREGEAIAYEVIEICRKANPKLEIKRAHFSVVESGEIKNALENLKEPNQNLAFAVDLRQELDLRIGSCYTVFQTVTLQQRHNKLKYRTISYGPCQIPTLGFVVERFKERARFRSEKFWFLEGVYHQSNDSKPITLNWGNSKSSSERDIQTILKALNRPYSAKITNIKETETLKYKPYPLNTITLQKLASDHLNYSADKTMKTAELLYNKGFISYPRTETNAFKPNINFKRLVELQRDHEVLGEYALGLLENRVYPPREGHKNDHSHPPIYPANPLTRKAFNLDDSNLITQEEITLYELIARCFLASCSKDAVAHETLIELNIQSQPFFFKQLKIKELNFLKIYPYDQFYETPIFSEKFQLNQILENIKISIKEGKTYPPKLLKEAQLIDLMDKNGIGTDSTIHEHIKKIQDREYAIKINGEFHPTALGFALIETYGELGVEIAQPTLRSEMEKGIKMVADGIERKENVLNKNLASFEEIYKKLAEDKEKFGDVFIRIFNENSGVLQSPEKEKVQRSYYKKQKK